MNCLLPMWQFCDLELIVNRLTRFSEYHYKAGSNGFGTRVKTESHKGDIICPHCPRYLLCIIWQSVPKHHPWHESHTGSKCEARQSALDGLGSPPQRLSCAWHLMLSVSAETAAATFLWGSGRWQETSLRPSVWGPLLCFCCGKSNCHRNFVWRNRILVDGTENYPKKCTVR